MDEPIFQQTDDPLDFVLGYFEDFLREGGFIVGVNTLDEFYEAGGAPRRPADEYLWNLAGKQGTVIKFNKSELNELKEQNEIIQAADYPQYLKDAISELLKREKARNEGRNLSRGKAAGILNANRGVNLVGNNMPATKKAFSIPGFATTVGSFLTGTPRISKESRGTVDPALRNLRLRAQGEMPAPLRPYGTGTGGRRKTKKSKKPKRKTRAVKKN